MIKVRLHGTPEAVNKFAEYLKTLKPCVKVLSRSDECPDHGQSVYVRVYLDVDYNDQPQAQKPQQNVGVINTAIDLKSQFRIDELRRHYSDKKIALDDMPKEVLLKLLTSAIKRIDGLKNLSGGIDKRDSRELEKDTYFVVDDLFKEVEQKSK